VLEYRAYRWRAEWNGASLGDRQGGYGFAICWEELRTVGCPHQLGG